MGKIIKCFPIFVILLCVGLTLYETEQSTIMKICGFVIYIVGVLLAAVSWQKIIIKINKQEEQINKQKEHIKDVEYALTQAEKDIALHEELITTLNKAVFFDTCHEVLPDIEAEGENDNE